MVEITKENLLHLAKLCRIACNDEEQEKLLHDFRKIVSYVELLNEVDTDNVDPCNYVTEGLAATPLREDVVQQSLSREEFLKGTASISGLVRVPSVFSNKGSLKNNLGKLDDRNGQDIDVHFEAHIVI
jgi:aspartyl-tRNA(Asn)/glutamyl-tRNA(Gln) amidotransferase subunit C